MTVELQSQAGLDLPQRIFGPLRTGDSRPIETSLKEARRLAASGQTEEAQEIYLEVLRLEPTHLAALRELGVLAHDNGHRAAARTLYEQAVRYHPDDALCRINLGNLLLEDGEPAAACPHYRAAITRDDCPVDAHRGLASALIELGDAEAAERHWRMAFRGQSAVAQRYRGAAPGVRVLLLVSAQGGNIPTRQLLDDRVFAVTALYAEFYEPRHALPRHDLVFNAIGDVDLCPAALARACEIVARTRAPIVNPPAQVRKTGRLANMRRLRRLKGVIAPGVHLLTRAAPSDGGLHFPLLLRAPGFHTGQHFVRVEKPEDLASAMAELPGAKLLAIQYLDARGRDGMARKYRVMMIGGSLYPIHLAIAGDWKVHYFTADMAQNAAHREEEKQFLEDMPQILGPRAMAALNHIRAALRLDYAGVDFGLALDGSLLLFEANATMVINPPPSDPIWDYRRAPLARALEAVKTLLLGKAGAVPTGYQRNSIPAVPE